MRIADRLRRARDRVVVGPAQPQLSPRLTNMEWRSEVEAIMERRRRNFRRWFLALGLIVILALVGSVVVYAQQRQAISREAGIVRSFTSARVANAQSACVDHNTLHDALRTIVTVLDPDPSAGLIVDREFPKFNCPLYVRETITTGRRPDHPPIARTP